MKYYYDRINNKYVALHNVNHKDVPAGFVEITEEEYHTHHCEIDPKEFEVHLMGEVIGIE